MVRTYIESTDAKFKTQLGGFCKVYPEYASILDVLASKIDRLNASNAVMQMIFAQQEIMQTFGIGFTAYEGF